MRLDAADTSSELGPGGQNDSATSRCPHLADRGEQRSCLVLVLEELALGHGIVDHAGGGLDRRDSVGDDTGSNGDREVHALHPGAM